MSEERVLIVTPTFNERENLARFLEGVFEVLPRAHVLVVDDASPDGTGDLAEEIAATDERVDVLHRPGKLGLGTAYLDGFRWGLTEGFDVFFEMDTDLSHDPRYLPDFLDALADGADLVIGSRNVAGDAGPAPLRPAAADDCANRGRTAPCRLAGVARPVA